MTDNPFQAPVNENPSSTRRRIGCVWIILGLLLTMFLLLSLFAVKMDSSVAPPTITPAPVSMEPVSAEAEAAGGESSTSANENGAE